MVQLWEIGCVGPVLDYFLGELCHQFSLWMPDVFLMHFWKGPALWWKLAICRILKGWIDSPQTILIKIGHSLSVPGFSSIQGHASRVMFVWRTSCWEKSLCAMNSKPLSGFNELSGEYSACIMQSLLPHGWTRKTSRQILSIVQIYRCGNIKP